MKNSLIIYSFLYFILLCLFPVLLLAADQSSDDNVTFSQAELDQMMAPIALYPDSLLSQILMASTYPANVAEAVSWSKQNPSQKGDAAVTAVQDKSWDPSVMSLVAFPQVLEMMGKKPDWVQNLGDAFLASPDKVMDSAQKLRKKAKDEGNLKTTEQQTVKVETEAKQTIVIIEPKDPETVYIPVYNPVVVYGTWWWPHYTPYYYRPIGYPLAAGISFGIGVAITRSLWGGCNWRRGSVNINVNKYNNININKINGRGSSSWKHNNKNRGGTPYRDKNTRDKYSKNKKGRESRQNYRGRDNVSSERNTQRQKAQNTLKNRGADPVAGRDKLKGKSGENIRKQTNKMNRQQQQNRSKAQSFDKGSLRNQANTANRSSRNESFSQNRNRGNNNALSGVRDSNRTSRNINRGSSSRNSFRSNTGGFRGGRGGRR